MKKILIVLSIVVSLVAVSLFSIFSIQKAIVSSAPNTEEWILENDKFTIVPAVGDTVTFHIENKQGEIVFKCSNEWRAWDFETLNIDDHNTITIVTGDMGTQEYHYNGKTWI